MAGAPTLFDWAGGRDAFDRMINAVYDRVQQDPLLSPFFPGGVHEEHRRNVATWWCEVFGGPAEYTSELGGYERMVRKHLQLGITNDQRFRFAPLMTWPPTMPGCQMTPSFVLLSLRISNGEPAWPSLTHKPTPTSPSMRPYHGGVGEKHLPIRPDARGPDSSTTN